MRKALEEQVRRLEIEKRNLAEQEAQLKRTRQALLETENKINALLGRVRGTGTGAAVMAQAPAQEPTAPVGQPPAETRAPQVAPIFEQRGVLTPRGQVVLEPSLQYAYSSGSRIALAGYTIIPAILIGVVDVREIKRNSFTAALTGRYGITNRFEVEARVPYVYRSDSTLARPIASGEASDFLYETSTSHLGDIDFTARYQLNEGGLDRPYYVGSLRFKTRTGLDPFEVSKVVVPLSGGQVLDAKLPTGSGFYSLQPGITFIYPSDPAVLFGGLSYTYNFERKNVSVHTATGVSEVGDVKAGDIIGFNFGMGLAINERSSFSVGYDHASVGKTKINAVNAPLSQRVQLGTLLLGYSYRFAPNKSVNVSLGVGTTRDAPDTQLTLRMPITF